MSQAQLAALGMGIAATLYVLVIAANLLRRLNVTTRLARAGLIVATLVGFIADIVGLPAGTSKVSIFVVGNQLVTWRMAPGALWILVPAWLAVLLAVWVRREVGTWEENAKTWNKDSLRVKRIKVLK
jgi:hypothetical protein